MLSNPSVENHCTLVHVLNPLLKYGNVPEQWKRAIVFPILKNGKPH